MISRDKHDLLFHGRELRALISEYEDEIRKEVDSWERNKILGASKHDLVVYLVEKYTLDAPRLLRGGHAIPRPGASG